MKYEVSSVDAYIDAIPDDRTEAIVTLIGLIHNAAPKVEESLIYKMPTYTMHGELLFAVASQKNYMSLYVMDAKLINEYLPQIGKVNVGKCCIRFKKLEHLNLEAVEQLLKEAYSKKIK
jgi:uncharacterized protein YdhG (YjbR/CyaY superfamily)